MSPKEERKTITDGLLVTVFEDEGPANIYNSSPLSEDEAFTMAIKTLTAIGSSTPFQTGEIRSHGPLPTPRDPLFAIAYMFSLKAVNSMDNRISQFGRMVIFWIITSSRSIINYNEFIIRSIKRNLRLHQINTDTDLYDKERLKKIDEKLQISDYSSETYYVTVEDRVESFLNIEMIPDTAPIVIVDSSTGLIQVLFRDQPTPLMKTKIRGIINDFKNQQRKGSLLKVDIISDKIMVNRLLTKAGLDIQPETGVHHRFRITYDLAFDELDEFISVLIKNQRTLLSKRIVSAYNAKEPLDLHSLANESGFTTEFLVQIVQKAIDSNVIIQATLENGVLKFQ
ncbi:MAG: hypothetical protein ACXAC6_00725 [Candidatus Hodarchaeales archaeon]|jgi:hypothetical protein